MQLYQLSAGIIYTSGDAGAGWMDENHQSVGLSVCPVCGKSLSSEGETCDCSGRIDHKPFLALIASSRVELDKARLSLVSGRYEEVELHCKRALELYDGVFGDAQILRALSAIEVADFERAYELIQTLVEDNKKDELMDRLESAEKRDRAARERFNIALRNVREGRLDTVEEELLKAIELAPYLNAPYRLLIKTYIEAKRVENARSWIERARKRFPRDVSIIELEKTVYGEGESGGLGEPIASFFSVRSIGLLSLFQAVVLVVLVILLLVLISQR
ncbi:hypothetical protein J7K50_05760 [bacterium]|nr:hypothetical protein [bacterium]